LRELDAGRNGRCFPAAMPGSVRNAGDPLTHETSGMEKGMVVDTALRQRESAGKPIRVGMIGAGATGRAIALQLATPVPGLRLLAIADRMLANAERAFSEAGVDGWIRVSKVAEAESAISYGAPIVVDDPRVLTACESIDVIVEATGTVEGGADVVLHAIEHNKHVVMVNAELDSLLGPILNERARKAGVVLTNTDGDEPGVAMTLLRYLRTIGLRTVAAGNIKGMVDHYRNPDTQRKFARQNNQDARKVTSFADGTRLAMGSTVLANATGFRVGRRGMYGPVCNYVREIADRLPAEKMLESGLIDYALGAAPHTGAFAIVAEDAPLKQAQLAYYKLGNGPFYVFYTPFHLPHIQIASTIGRAVVDKDPTVAAIGGPVCGVLTIAKRDLKAGDRLDGVGGFDAYGQIDNVNEAQRDNALPIGLAENCVLRRNKRKDELVSFDDVELPVARTIDALWREQQARWNNNVDSKQNPELRKSAASPSAPSHY
jgi:predicted homoserine dehydrogenase-like protein